MFDENFILWKMFRKILKTVLLACLFAVLDAWSMDRVVGANAFKKCASISNVDLSNAQNLQIIEKLKK